MPLDPAVGSYTARKRESAWDLIDTASNGQRAARNTRSVVLPRSASMKP
jgi:hypothetical protein